MDFYVFNSDYTLLGILSSPVSVDYVEKYNDLGTFELVLPIDENNVSLMNTDNVILFDKEKGIAGVIYGIGSVQSDKSPQITVKGNLIEDYIYRRICWGLFENTDTPENVIYKMLDTQVLNPSDPKRRISDIVTEPISTATKTNISYQNTGGVVGENISSICASSDLGFKLKFDPVNKRCIFKLYKGTDRTRDQKAVPPAIFSVEYENILSSEYNISVQDMKNVALVAGEGEGLDRVMSSVGDVSGKSRREYFVDARDLQSTNSDGMEITKDQYLLMLQQRGTEKLTDLKTSQSFDCTINTQGNIQYNRDFFLGDLVTIQDKLLSIDLDAKITEVEHAFTSTGEELFITFGFGTLSLTKKLKVKGV